MAHTLAVCLLCSKQSCMVYENTQLGEAGSVDILFVQMRKLWVIVSVTHDILPCFIIFMFFIDWQYSSQLKIQFNLLLSASVSSQVSSSRCSTSTAILGVKGRPRNVLGLCWNSSDVLS